MHYLEITRDLRTTDQLIISYNKRHQAVATSTISRWFKVILGKAGIDIEKYSSQSTRSVSTIKAKIKRHATCKMQCYLTHFSWQNTSELTNISPVKEGSHLHAGQD